MLFMKDYPLNPKALNIIEVYGGFYLGNHSFKDGVLSSIMRQACAGKKASALDIRILT